MDLEVLEAEELGHPGAAGGDGVGGAGDIGVEATVGWLGAATRLARRHGHAPVEPGRVEMAGHPDAVGEDDLGRLDLAADVHRRRAARVEPAARWWIQQVGRRTRDRLERPPIGVDVGERPEQLLGVRVAWRGEEPSDRALLGDLARVHDQHPVARLGDHRQVVGDEDQAQPELPPKSLEQLQDLGLDHHVEGRGGLVADDDRRIAGERHRDHRPLAHPAGELVRVRPGPGPRDPDELEQLAGPGARPCPATARAGARSARRSARRSGGPG